MSKIVDIAGVTQLTDVQIEASVQTLAFELGGTFSAAQGEAVRIELRRVGQIEGTQQVLFDDQLVDYLEIDAQINGGTFGLTPDIVGTSAVIYGSISLAKAASIFVGKGDQLVLNVRGLQTTMRVKIYALETKAMAYDYLRYMPVNIAGMAPLQRNVTSEALMFVPNDGTIDRIQVGYKGRTCNYELEELQAMNRGVRSMISPDYDGAVYAGFVNWLMFPLKDVITVQLQPSISNVNTKFYMLDRFEVASVGGNLVVASSIPSVVDSGKKDFGRVTVAKVDATRKAVK